MHKVVLRKALGRPVDKALHMAMVLERLGKRKALVHTVLGKELALGNIGVFLWRCWSL